MRRVGVRSPFSTPEDHPLYPKNHSSSNSRSHGHGHSCSYNSYRNRRRSPPPLLPRPPASSSSSSSSSSASRHYAPLRAPERAERKRPRHLAHARAPSSDETYAWMDLDLLSGKPSSSSPLIGACPPSRSPPLLKGRRFLDLAPIARTMDEDGSFQIGDATLEALCEEDEEVATAARDMVGTWNEAVICASDSRICLSKSNDDKGREGSPPEKGAATPHSDLSLASSRSPSSPSVVDVTDKFKLAADKVSKQQPIESDLHRLSQRQKQIDLGKNTLGYESYTNLVPRYMRKKTDPRTPMKTQVCSKRSWEGQVRKWRRLLHAYDPPAEEGEEVAEDLMCLKQVQKPLIAESPTTPRGEEDLAKKDTDLSIYGEWTELEP